MGVGGLGGWVARLLGGCGSGWLVGWVVVYDRWVVVEDRWVGVCERWVGGEKSCGW